MRLLEILSEGRDAPLYHWMDHEKTLDVLQKDRLKPLFRHKFIKDAGLGISMTRNKNYSHNWANASVRLTFDQARLANDHKIIPVDAHNIRLTPKKFKKDYDGTTDRTLYGHENEQMAEEFVIGEIKPLHRYVTEVLFYNNGNDREWENLPVMLWTRKFNIPLKIDGDLKNWEMWVKDTNDALAGEEDTFSDYLRKSIKHLKLKQYL